MTASSHTKRRRKDQRRGRHRMADLTRRTESRRRHRRDDEYLPEPDGFAGWLADQRRTLADRERNLP